MSVRDHWKVAILVDSTESKSAADQMVRQLRHMGFDAIHVFGSPKAKINKQRDIVVHQDKSWHDDYSMWRSAIRTMSEGYAAQTELFLFVRPDIRCWEQLPVYCENTIDRSIVAIWSPYTPYRVFPDEYVIRPNCGDDSFGWCPSRVNGSWVANHCLIFSRHALTLCGAYLPELSSMGMNTAGSIGVSLERFDVPVYFHTPSLVGHLNHQYTAHDFVGCSHHMNQSDMRNRNFILERDNCHVG